MPSHPQYKIVTDELLESIEIQTRAEQSEWLFLEQSETFQGCWEVVGLWPEYFIDFEPIIGNYRLVTPLGLNEFLTACGEWGYKPVFLEDPINIIDALENWKVEPSVSLNSDLAGTIKGFLPWQVVGFNKLIKDENIDAGYVVWDTGAGKTAFMASAIKYHTEVGSPFDVALVTVKSHNKVDTQRKLLKLAGIDSIILHGSTIDKRYDLYEQLQDKLLADEPVVAITNYEKFREDADVFKFLLNKRRCLFFWDEMPNKLANRETALYKSVKKSLYASFSSNPRPSWMRHWILTATPIENSPNDVFSCVNLAWPRLLGSTTEFKRIHVAAINHLTRKPVAWKNLDHMEAKLNFMMHRVSKEDPEVAKMFPKDIPLPQVVDWNPKHRQVYDKLSGKAADILDEFADANILTMIQVMQMVCDAPSMVKQSATNREAFSALLSQFGDLEAADIPWSGPRGSDIAVTLLEAVDPKLLIDVGHTKLDMWHEIIEKHRGEKIITHSTWANYIFPIWQEHLDKWGITYITYAGTPKAKQTALDEFRDNPDIQMFLSGDAGSDSLDIPEARVGVNYNIPWKWTTLTQRQGRRSRPTSVFDTIFTYSLLMENSIDERKLEITEMKHGYHKAVFEGHARDVAVSASMSRADLVYILSGRIDSTDE